jgi:hypothetical protein
MKKIAALLVIFGIMGFVSSTTNNEKKTKKIVERRPASIKREAPRLHNIIKIDKSKIWNNRLKIKAMRNLNLEFRNGDGKKVSRDSYTVNTSATDFFAKGDYSSWKIADTGNVEYLEIGKWGIQGELGDDFTLYIFTLLDYKGRKREISIRRVSNEIKFQVTLDVDYEDVLKTQINLTDEDSRTKCTIEKDSVAYCSLDYYGKNNEKEITAKVAYRSDDGEIKESIFSHFIAF